MKTLALLLLVCNLHASDCDIDFKFVHVKLTGLDIYQLTESMCGVSEKKAEIVIHKLTRDWCRALVNKNIIIYLHKDKAWKVVAVNNRFDISDWDKYEIPEFIW